MSVSAPVPASIVNKSNITVSIDSETGELVYSGTIDGNTVTQSFHISSNCIVIFSPSNKNYYTIALPQIPEGDQFVDLYTSVKID